MTGRTLARSSAGADQPEVGADRRPATSSAPRPAPWPWSSASSRPAPRAAALPIRAGELGLVGEEPRGVAGHLAVLRGVEDQAQVAGAHGLDERRVRAADLGRVDVAARVGLQAAVAVAVDRRRAARRRRRRRPGPRARARRRRPPGRAGPAPSRCCGRVRRAPPGAGCSRAPSGRRTARTSRGSTGVSARQRRALPRSSCSAPYGTITESVSWRTR